MIQCCYCAHLSFTNPLTAEAAADLGEQPGLNNFRDGEPPPSALTEALPAPPPPPLLLLGDDSEGKGMVMGWENPTAQHGAISEWTARAEEAEGEMEAQGADGRDEEGWGEGGGGGRRAGL